MAYDPGATSALRRLSSDWNTAAHAGPGWPLFLAAVKISGLRGWTGESIEFRFPVVAIAGENGSGKSTVLKAAAAAYLNSSTAEKQLNPDDFFPSTQWEAVAGVRIEYTYRQGDTVFAHTVRKPTKRWKGLPQRAKRQLYFLDISRTQPINTLIGYGKVAVEQTFGDSEVELDDENRARLSRILRRSFDAGKLVVSDVGRKQVGVVTREGTTYSNFHQGAGEDSSMDLLALLQAAPANSLVIIDEVEASLHPRAQRRLMTEIFELARLKRLQFIVSTHSPYILEQMPEVGKVYVQTTPDGSRNLLYGISSNLALTLMDDERHPDLTLYLEDERAAHLCFALAVAEDDSLRQRLRFIHVGAATVVRALGKLINTDKLGIPALGVLDADEGAGEGCVVLPGTAAPEIEVFGALGPTDWTSLAQRLAVSPALLQEAVADAMVLANHHDWPLSVADALGGTMTRRRVWESVSEYYANSLIDAATRRAFVDLIKDQLPPASSVSS